MGSTTAEHGSRSHRGQELRDSTDVLVLGGGPAGAWAALRAAQSGARVMLVDKGYCGSSGATAPSGTGVWYVPPDSAAREAAMNSRDALGGFLASRHWMTRVLDTTYASMNALADWGYPFPVDDRGHSYRRSLQGPAYMRLLRRLLLSSGVRILDQSPALELISDAAGAVCGAAGVQRQTGNAWLVRSGSVVIATGGCAFLSKALGCNVLTGDGYLMAAEAGADLSGMEFSNAYGLAPAFSSVTKSLFYRWASFYYENGAPIEGAGSQRGRSVIARTLQSQPVYAILDQADEATRHYMRAAQPNFFLPFDRRGIDPFTQRFPVTLRLEGTVRGTGGIRIRAEDCSTSVPGLYAAGDAATREPICGGFTGGGSHNAAWAIASGSWAGSAAARHAHTTGTHSGTFSGQGCGTAILDPTGHSRALRVADIVTTVQAEVFPFRKNLFRREASLTASLASLNQLWCAVREGGLTPGEDLWRGREAAAMTATARWMYASALARRESRGMHQREDYSGNDPAQQHRLICGGLDDIRIASESLDRNPGVAA